MPKLLSLLKSVFISFLLILLLYTTGFLQTASVHAQSLLLRTGLLNATPQSNSAEPFPFEFTLKTLDGESIKMESLQGKVIFLNLWATWCGPCRAEMPNIQKLYTSMKGDSIAFVMLAIDKKGEEPKIKKYLHEKGFTFPIYRPAYAGDSSFPEILRVPSIPTTFVIDKQGNVAYKNVGTANYNTNKFKNFLKDLLNK